MWLKKKVGENVHKAALPLSVSTEAQDLELKLYALRKYKETIGIPDINALYRAFLGILKSKIHEASFADVIEDVSEKREPAMPYEFVRKANSVVKLPEPINRIIANIGMVIHSEETFLPVIPKDIYDTQGNFTPVPQFIYLKNLQKTVDGLSRAETPHIYIYI